MTVQSVGCVVLLVEDNPADADLVEDLLDQARPGHYEILRASRIEEALQILARMRVDVILLDLQLADAAGVQTVRAIKSVTTDVPVVVLTGFDDEELALKCIDAGAQDYQTKGRIRSENLDNSIRYSMTRLKLERQFLQAQRMEAVGLLAGSVAHDFNNLLTAINGYAMLGIDQLAEGHPLLYHLREIKKAAESAASLTRQLLTFSRKQVLQPTVLSLNPVIEGLRNMLTRLIGKEIRFQIRVDPDLGYVRADAGQIEQILMNLVLNARDAMPRGGRLTVITENIDLDSDYSSEHFEIEPGPYVLLSVSDTGVGIDPVNANRLDSPSRNWPIMNRR